MRGSPKCYCSSSILDGSRRWPMPGSGRSRVAWWIMIIVTWVWYQVHNHKTFTLENLLQLQLETRGNAVLLVFFSLKKNKQTYKQANRLLLLRIYAIYWLDIPSKPKLILSRVLNMTSLRYLLATLCVHKHWLHMSPTF